MNTWNQTANSIFLDAIEIEDLRDRTLFLENACHGLPHEIKSDVLELLNAHEESTGFLDDRIFGSESNGTNSSIVPQSPSIFKKNASDHSLPSGAMLGRYRIERVLGNGGMGVVYLAIDTRLGRSVAIKIPRTEQLRDSLPRMEREARTMASVKHRNLASILDVDQCDGVTFLVMDFISGKSLSDRLRDNKEMSSNEIATLMIKLAAATDCAHAAGIVHRDIKPANIIIDDSNEPILMDFGLAYSESDDARMTKSGAILGTPAYMAPEQVIGATHLVGPHSDVYALGAILYELLSGSMVYQGNTSAVLDSLANGKPVVPPSSLRPNVDKWLESICLKAIAHNSSQRFQSAGEFADALQFFLNDDKAKLQSLLGLDKPRTVANKYTWMASGLIGAMLVGAVYFILTIKNETPRPTTTQAPSNQGPVVNSNLAWSEPERVKFIHGNVPASNASISGDGLRLVYMLRTESGLELCESTRTDRNAAFSEPMSIRDLYFDVDKTALGKRFGNPWLSHDGLELVLYCMRPELGTDLFHTQRESLDSPWQELRSLGSEVNTKGAEYAGSMSKDKLTFYWFRPHPDNVYDGELWTASRQKPIEHFASARLLGKGINTEASEQHPCISYDGLLLTFDRGTPDPRLWQARRSDLNEDFGDAYPIELPGTWKDTNAYSPSLTADNNLLIFTSNAIPGKEGFETGELWQSYRVP